MKPLREIEDTRRDYHADAQHNTVHRASLLAPALSGSKVDFSFVNHFLLKRGHENVACRLTAIDGNGKRLDSRTYQIREPRVYAFELSELGDDTVANYMIEFFSPTNLFIPFPAAVVNHRNDSYLNFVHSYNRVLNDVFEDDAINAHVVSEASIDVHVDESTDTFAIFTAGPQPCQGTVEVSVKSPGQHLRREVAVDLPRFGNQEISLRTLFPDAQPPRGAVFTVRQPQQFLFYGRMLAGRRSTPDGAVSANHSFYDCSGVEEYWDNGEPSRRVYPLPQGFRARIRLYPIFSPCRMLGEVVVRDAAGQVLATVPCEPLDCPSDAHLDLSVSDAIDERGLEGAVAFEYRAWPEAGGTPRRVNHQIVYEDVEELSPLTASAAISLRNPNMFEPPHKSGLTWGQCAVGPDLDSKVGITLDRADGRTEPVRVRLFGEDGVVYDETLDLVAGAALLLDPAELVPDLPAREGRPHYVWYWAECSRADLAAYSIVRHRVSGHCAGEHSF